MPPIDYDFDSKGMDYDPNYQPRNNYTSQEEFIIDIYKNI